MKTKQSKRLERERAAAQFLEANHPKMAEMFESVAVDLGAELDSLPKAQRRARQAAEMAYRLDNMVDLAGFSPIAEALDYFAFFLAALGFLALVDSIEAAAKRKKEKVVKLREKLKQRGPKMTTAARRRIERRIKRLETPKT